MGGLGDARGVRIESETGTGSTGCERTGFLRRKLQQLGALKETATGTICRSTAVIGGEL